MATWQAAGERPASASLRRRYVLVSRVRTLDSLRLLQDDLAGRQALARLRHDVYLGAWERGYDRLSGRWSDDLAAAALKEALRSRQSTKRPQAVAKCKAAAVKTRLAGAVAKKRPLGGLPAAAAPDDRPAGPGAAAAPAEPAKQATAAARRPGAITALASKRARGLPPDTLPPVSPAPAARGKRKAPCADEAGHSVRRTLSPPVAAPRRALPAESSGPTAGRDNEQSDRRRVRLPRGASSSAVCGAVMASEATPYSDGELEAHVEAALCVLSTDTCDDCAFEELYARLERDPRVAVGGREAVTRVLCTMDAADKLMLREGRVHLM